MESTCPDVANLRTLSPHPSRHFYGLSIPGQITRALACTARSRLTDRMACRTRSNRIVPSIGRFPLQPFPFQLHATGSKRLGEGRASILSNHPPHLFANPYLTAKSANDRSPLTLDPSPQHICLTLFIHPQERGRPVSYGSSQQQALRSGPFYCYYFSANDNPPTGTPISR